MDKSKIRAIFKDEFRCGTNASGTACKINSASIGILFFYPNHIRSFMSNQQSKKA